MTVSCQGTGSACVKGEVTSNSRSRGIFPLKPCSWSEEMEAQVGDVSCTGPIVLLELMDPKTMGLSDSDKGPSQRSGKQELSSVVLTDIIENLMY